MEGVGGFGSEENCGCVGLWIDVSVIGLFKWWVEGECVKFVFYYCDGFLVNKEDEGWGISIGLVLEGWEVWLKCIVKFVYVLEVVYCDDCSVVILVECIVNLRFSEYVYVF